GHYSRAPRRGPASPGVSPPPTTSGLCGPPAAAARASAHARIKLQHRPVDREAAIALVVDGFRRLLLGIDPGLHRFEDEKVVAPDQRPVGNPAFQIGEAFGNEGAATFFAGRAVR